MSEVTFFLPYIERQMFIVRPTREKDIQPKILDKKFGTFWQDEHFGLIPSFRVYFSFIPLKTFANSSRGIKLLLFLISIVAVLHGVLINGMHLRLLIRACKHASII